MEHLDWGLQMTVLGMGLVFSMLALLWLLLTVVLKFDKEEVEAAPAPAAASNDAAEEEEAAAADVEAVAAPAADEGQTIDGMAADVLAAIMVAAMKHKLILRSEAAPMVRTNWPGTQPSRWAAAGRVRQTNTWTPRG